MAVWAVDPDHPVRVTSLEERLCSSIALPRFYTTLLGSFAVGDTIVTTYIASLEGELRTPTEEELANPWVEVDGAAKAPEDVDPGVIAGRVIHEQVAWHHHR